MRENAHRERAGGMAGRHALAGAEDARLRCIDGGLATGTPVLDDGFTYGGLVLGLAALALWLRLASRAVPSFETMLARYQDERVASEIGPPSGLGRLAVCATAMALTFSAIGYVIPD